MECRCCGPAGDRPAPRLNPLQCLTHRRVPAQCKALGCPLTARPVIEGWRRRDRSRSTSPDASQSGRARPRHTHPFMAHPTKGGGGGARTRRSNGNGRLRWGHPRPNTTPPPSGPTRGLGACLRSGFWRPMSCTRTTVPPLPLGQRPVMLRRLTAGRSLESKTRELVLRQGPGLMSAVRESAG